MMEIIKMTVKPQTLEAIRAGEIEEYAREVRPNTQEKYCQLDDDGYVMDIDGVLQPRHYDVIQFKSGHETCACKIEDAYIELFEDENGELVVYEEGGEEYIKAQVVYVLGEKIML